MQKQLNLFYSLSFITLFLLTANISSAQTINNSIELRPRVIINEGYITPRMQGSSTPVYITQRSRFNVGYENNRLETYLSIQDVRFWGDINFNNDNNSSTIGLDLAQGWFKINVNKKLSVKIGRQIFNYDDQRVVAARNWRDNQLANDALFTQYKNKNHKIDLSFVWNTENKNNFIYPSDNYRTFNFLHYEYSKNNLTFSNMNIVSARNINDSSSTMHSKATHGLFGKYNNGIIEFQSSFYFQYSLDTNNTRNRAFSYSANIWFSPVNANKIKMGLGVHYLSGQDMTKTENDYQNTNHQFDKLQGKRHGFYGYMDYFSVTPEQGLQNYMVNFKINLYKQLSLQADGHFFWLAADYINPNQSTSTPLNKYLGSELDLTLKWQIIKEAQLQAGYSFFLLSNTMEIIKDLDNADYRFPQFAYLMITVKPKWKINLKQ